MKKCKKDYKHRIQRKSQKKKKIQDYYIKFVWAGKLTKLREEKEREANVHS